MFGQEHAEKQYKLENRKYGIELFGNTLSKGIETQNSSIPCFFVSCSKK